MPIILLFGLIRSLVAKCSQTPDEQIRELYGKKFKISEMKYCKDLILILVTVIFIFLTFLLIRLWNQQRYKEDIESIYVEPPWIKRNEETIQHENEEVKKLRDMYNLD